METATEIAVLEIYRLFALKIALKFLVQNGQIGFALQNARLLKGCPRNVSVTLDTAVMNFVM